jgi:spore cortex formation protein SpoVR/YcgB (stage V sporulation)
MLEYFYSYFYAPADTPDATSKPEDSTITPAINVNQDVKKDIAIDQLKIDADQDKKNSTIDQIESNVTNVIVNKKKRKRTKHEKDVPIVSKTPKSNILYFHNGKAITESDLVRETHKDTVHTQTKVSYPRYGKPQYQRIPKHEGKQFANFDISRN